LGFDRWCEDQIPAKAIKARPGNNRPALGSIAVNQGIETMTFANGKPGRSFVQSKIFEILKSQKRKAVS
jgi:hypothetical protein